MSPMKIVGVLVLFGLIISPFLTLSVYSQTPEQRTDCSHLFEVEWAQFEGETVDKVTVCAEGKMKASIVGPAEFEEFPEIVARVVEKLLFLAPQASVGA